MRPGNGDPKNGDGGYRAAVLFNVTLTQQFGYLRCAISNSNYKKCCGNRSCPFTFQMQANISFAN